MKVKTYYIQECANEEYNAGSKARNDFNTIMQEMAFSPIEVAECRQITKPSEVYQTQHTLRQNWRKIWSSVNDNDIVIMQYPFGPYFGSYTINSYHLKRIKAVKDVKFIGVIHDLVHLQEPLLVRQSTELNTLQYFDVLIVHNAKMAQKLVDLGFDQDKLVCLGVFDYLTNVTTKRHNLDEGVCVAGNLMKRKAGYVYKLAQNDRLNLHLYGPNYTGIKTPTTNYHGSLHPEQLMRVIKGAYCLIWDGPSDEEISGSYGKYQRINNPFRVSMAIASRIPLIVSDEAAVASFVEKNRIGIVVASIKDLDQTLEMISTRQYREMNRNIKRIAKMVTTGKFTKVAIKKGLAKLDEQAN